MHITTWYVMRTAVAVQSTSSANLHTNQNLVLYRLDKLGRAQLLVFLDSDNYIKEPLVHL